MKRFLAVSLITIGLSFSLSAQEHTKRPPKSTPSSTPSVPARLGDPSWVEFSSEAGRFSVLMPGTPKHETKTEDTKQGPYTTNLFILKGTRNVFLIGWVDYDPNFNLNWQLEMELNRDNFVKGVSGRLLSSRALTIDDYPALEFTAETEDRIFTSRVYMVGRRPYQIVIGSPKGTNDSVYVKRFFNSFKVSM